MDDASTGNCAPSKHVFTSVAVLLLHPQCLVHARIQHMLVLVACLSPVLLSYVDCIVHFCLTALRKNTLLLHMIATGWHLQLSILAGTV